MNKAIKTNLESLVLRKIAEVSQKHVVDETGLDAPTISRICSDQNGLHLSKLEGFLEALGLKVIECAGDTVTVPVEEYAALQILAIKGLKGGKK